MINKLKEKIKAQAKITSNYKILPALKELKSQVI